MKIKDLLKDVEIIDKYQDQPDLDIDMVYYDSRKVEPGGLFVAIDGLEVDGHAYIQEALDRGAVAIMVTKDVDFDVPCYKTLNNRKALAQVSCSYYGHPSRDLKIYGITASNGKTSTSMLLKSILQAAGQEPGLVGTVMYEIGDLQIASKLTTPESLELQGIFRSMVDEGIDTCIMEVSSVGQEMYRVYGTDFDTVCMNNITREHIDQHGTFEKYFEEKKKTITQAKEDSYVILNLEDKYATSLVNETEGQVIAFSDRDPKAHVYAENIDISTGFGSFDLCLSDKMPQGPDKARVQLKAAGYHSIVNALSAASMALAQGIDLATVAQGLGDYTGIERRFQLVYDDEFMILDDHFANIANIDMTLQTLSQMDYKRAHILYAIRGNRGTTVNGENVDTFLKWADQLDLANFYATKSVEVVEAHDWVSDEEDAIFREKMDGNQDYVLFDRLDESISAIIDQVQEGDVLLLAGCQGMDHGARLALEEISSRQPDKDRSRLFKVLEDRVAGMDDCPC